MSDDKGKFSANIGDEVIKAALESVLKRTGEVPVSAPVEPGEVEVKIDAEGSAGDPRDQEIAELKVQLEVSQAAGRTVMGRIKDEHEKVLRATADLENFKKRSQKEKDELQRFGNEKLLKDLLPIVDNFDRAFQHLGVGGDFASLEKGVTMIRKLFEDALGKHGVKAFASKGKPFDPNLHEAMQHVETDDLPANHVASELVRGFMLNDRLMRPALVMVSKRTTQVAEQLPERPEEPSAEAEAEKKS